MSGRLRVKNWRRFQHYRDTDRPLPWIKLHVNLLNDEKFNALSAAKRWQLVSIWLLAATANGTIPSNAAFVARRIGARNVDLDAFVSQGWLEEISPDESPSPFEDTPF